MNLAEGFPLDAQKLDGYLEALTGAGVQPMDVVIVEAVPWETELYSVLKKAAPNATGWLVMSDRQALSILADIMSDGVPLPARPSVVGFDDVPESSDADLTTVAQPVREKGRLAAAMLLSGEAPREIRLPTRLIIRGSSRLGPAAA